ncbi:MAG: hypothetical protein ACTSRG_04915 [Candidatus Helarchaeota archaeon]
MVTNDNRKKIENSEEKFIIDIIQNRQVEIVEDLIRILDSEHNISPKSSLNTIKQLQKSGAITLEKPNPISGDLSSSNFFKFFRHNSNRDYWFIFLSTLCGLFFFIIIEDESPYAIFRAIFGLIAFFFSLGYVIIDIAFMKKDLEIYEKICLSIGLSTILSPLILYIVNFTPLQLTETYVYIQYSIILFLSALFLFIRYKKADLANLISKKPIIERKRILILVVLVLIIAALVRAWNIYPYPLFGTPSDPWIHYGISKAAINLKWFEFYYGAIYDVFYPLYYMTLVGLKFISGFGLLLTCKTTPMIISIFSTFILMILAFRATKKWEIAILTGLFCSTIDVITPVNSATLWPQTIGYMFFPLIIYAFLRVNEEPEIKNVILAFSFFAYLTITHVVSIAAVIAALFLIAITLIYKKTYTKWFIFTLIVSLGFFGIWSSVFYVNKLAELASFNLSRLDFSLVMILGVAGLLGLGIIYFYLKRFGPTVRTGFELTFTKMSIIIILLVFGIGLNPVIWMIFPITSGFAQGLPFLDYIVIFLAVYPMLIIGILGFRVVFHRGGMRDQFLSGWLIGIIIIAALIMFGGNYLFSGRVGAFATGLFCILSAVAVFSIFSTFKNRTRKKIVILSLLTLYSTPFTLLYRYPLIYGIEETRFSEFQSLSWLSPHVTPFPVFIGDNRALYLIDGVVWSPTMSLQFIGDLPMLDNLEQIILATLTGLLPVFFRLAMYPVFFKFLKQWMTPFLELGFGPIYIPIFRYFFDVGPIDLVSRDETIPTLPLTVFDLIIFSNSKNYDKIYDNWYAYIFIPNI